MIDRGVNRDCLIYFLRINGELPGNLQNFLKTSLAAKGYVYYTSFLTARQCTFFTKEKLLRKMQFTTLRK